MPSPSAVPATSFPIVGIGASAGGLDAFMQLLSALPPDSGMAFVLIQHLDRTHPSLLGPALAKKTAMPVDEIRHGTVLEPDHVYVIAPNTDVGVSDGAFTVVPRAPNAAPHLPIDVFFRALAAEQGSQAIGVVLSGTASDGTAGLRAIKADGGVTLAQDPSTAAYNGMPQSAVSAGVVDLVLPLPLLAQELTRLGGHSYVAGERGDPEQIPDDAEDLRGVLLLLRNALGVDFSEYKENTVRRRVARRMALRKCDTVRDYATFLAKTAEEARALFEDMLIHVTSFFRDPAVFEALATRVLPEIVKRKLPHEPLRMWVTGCSTGEEAYSLAICVFEYLGEFGAAHPVQIFGTDLSDAAIAKVRVGVYPESALSHLSPARLQRFFSHVEGGYRVSKEIRDACVFVRHDVSRDPPFSKLDLISCRNVLIYFTPALQQRVLATFHYCLNTPGFLVLGRAEGLSGQKNLFSMFDKGNKILARTGPARQHGKGRTGMAPGPAPRGTVAAARGDGHASPSIDLAKSVDDLLLAQYAPAGVIVNERMEVLLFRGRTTPYLAAPPGKPDTNLLRMARSGLVAHLRIALARARKDLTTVRKDGLEVEGDGLTTRCNIVVMPLSVVPPSPEQLFAVLFERVGSAPTQTPRRGGRPGGKTRRADPSGPQLRQELRTTRQYLESLIEDREQTNEALMSTNEELISANEELQSLNEEMETSKEELQSTNEELTTLNDELQNRNQELGQLNSDVLNLLHGVEIPIVIVDGGLRIRRFTPQAGKTMNFLPGDVGRPITDIRQDLSAKHLGRQIVEVMASATMKEIQVQDGEGRWYRMQIRPYKTIDNKIDGAVLSLVDIDVLKQAELERARLLLQAEEASHAKDRFLAVLSHELRTPLTTLLLQVDMLKRRAREGRVIDAPIAAIERAARIQARLTDDLLDISRIAAGKLDLQLREISVVALVREALDMVSAIAAEKSIALEIALDEVTERVMGDPVRLRQVVWNLLTNAIKFTPAGGQVWIRLDQVDGQARLRVSDSGIGIAANVLPEIFNPFAQAEQGHGGLGLGLAIVRHVIELHHGSVSAASAGTHHGATFTVTLPTVVASAERRAVNEPAPATASISNGGDHVPELRGVRILIVEDESATREPLVEMVRSLGAEVEGVGSVAEAMQIFDRFRPRLLMCDIGMRDEDGYSLIRRIREFGPDRGGDVSAMALTALASEQDRQQALAAGFQMHLAKPVGFEEVTAALLTLHRLRPSERREPPSLKGGGSRR